MQNAHPEPEDARLGVSKPGGAALTEAAPGTGKLPAAMFITYGACWPELAAPYVVRCAAVDLREHSCTRSLPRLHQPAAMVMMTTDPCHMPGDNGCHTQNHVSHTAQHISAQNANMLCADPHTHAHAASDRKISTDSSHPSETIMGCAAWEASPR